MKKEQMQLCERIKEPRNKEYTEKEVYYFSVNRENILNWYAFDSNASVLEINGCTGILTGMLCNKVAKVVSIEESEYERQVNLERNKNCHNLEVVVGDLFQLNLQDKYDYIIWNDALIENKDQASAFFEKISRYAYTETRILISVANPLGAKYLAGSQNPISGWKFNSFGRNVGMTKADWESLFSKTSGWKIQWYYPYPDHIVPTEIHTDASIVSMEYGREYPNCNENRCCTWLDNDFFQGIDKEQRSFFANSFLLDISMQNNKDIYYVKLNADRKPEFQISTKILYKKDEKIVEKAPLCDRANDHIENMHRMEQRDNCKHIRSLPSKLRDGKAYYEFLKLHNLDYYVEECINEERSEEIYTILASFFEEYFQETTVEMYSTDKFAAYFGEPNDAESEQECICPANIDLICGNIYVDGQDYIIIDNEWILNIPVPKKFIIWRCINELYYVHAGLEEHISQAELMDSFEISAEEQEQYQKWNYYFTIQYIGTNQMKDYYYPLKMLAWDKDKSMLSKLYVDYGDGFSETNCITQTLKLEEQHFEVDFVVHGEIKMLRWDPLSDIVCGMKAHCESGGIECSLVPSEWSVDVDGWNWTFNGDPYYYLNGEDIKGQIHMEGEIRILDTCDVSKMSALAIAEQKQDNLRLQTLVEKQKEELNQVYNSRGWKLLEKTRKMIHIFRRK